MYNCNASLSMLSFLSFFLRSCWFIHTEGHQLSGLVDNFLFPMWVLVILYEVADLNHPIFLQKVPTFDRVPFELPPNIVMDQIFIDPLLTNCTQFDVIALEISWIHFLHLLQQLFYLMLVPHHQNIYGKSLKSQPKSVPQRLHHRRVLSETKAIDIENCLGRFVFIWISHGKKFNAFPQVLFMSPEAEDIDTVSLNDRALHTSRIK